MCQMYAHSPEAVHRAYHIRAVAKSSSLTISSTQALLRELGMTATSELRAMRQQLKELDLAVPAALGPEEQQRVFLELRGELRAERDFKTLLEATPGITVGTSWPLVKRKVCPEPPISWVNSCFTPQRGGCFVDST